MATHMSLYGTARVIAVFHSSSTTYCHTLTKRRVSHTIPNPNRTPRKRMALANKEANRHIRNILFNVGNVQHWSRVLCTTERVLNNSVKQPLGSSPNTLLNGDAFSVDRTLLTQIDQDVADLKARLTQDFVDTLIARQARIIDATIHSQTAINEANLRNLVC